MNAALLNPEYLQTLPTRTVRLVMWGTTGSEFMMAIPFGLPGDKQALKTPRDAAMEVIKVLESNKRPYTIASHQFHERSQELELYIDYVEGDKAN